MFGKSRSLQTNEQENIPVATTETPVDKDGFPETNYNSIYEQGWKVSNTGSIDFNEVYRKVLEEGGKEAAFLHMKKRLEFDTAVQFSIKYSGISIEESARIAKENVQNILGDFKKE